VALLIDYRVGSSDLFPTLLATGLPAVLTTLNFGDVAWTGIGAEGAVSCGVEVKTVSDLLNSMQTGRFAGHQVPGLLNTYDRVYLIIEEATRPDAGGVLEHYVKGKWWHRAKLGTQREAFTSRAYEKFLTTVGEHGNIHIRQTSSRAGTVACLASLYQWWVDGWGAHKSLLALDQTTQIRLADQCRKERGAGVSLLRKGPTFKRRIAAELPGVGAERSLDVAKGFACVLDMICASEKQWREVTGIGKGIAHSIYEAVRLKEAE
jgi:ERCC4-type nuclease